MGDGREILATALLLLLVSPLLGVGTLLTLRKAPLASLRQLLLINLVLTAITATAVTMLSVSVEQNSETEFRSTTLRMVAWTIPGVTADKPWWPVTLSVGVDRLNRAPLCWLAWGAVAAGLITTGRPPESAGRYALLLCLETAWLWTYAAYDGVVFLGASVTAGVAMAMLTAWWGREDRRAAAAARLWRWWLIADGLLLLGLLGLANAAVWSQQHLTDVLPALSLTWETLAEKLPRVAMHNQSAAQYWTASAGWWLWPLVLAAAIRCGVPPFHSATVQWWGQVSAPVGVLTILGGVPFAGYLWTRLLAPVFATELREQGAVLAGWGALATLGAGMFCLAQTEPRKFAAWFSLAGVSLTWLLFSSGNAVGCAASVTFAWGSAALLALVGLMDDRWPTSRGLMWSNLWQTTPLWSAALLVTFGSLVGFPAAARWSLDWQLAWSLAGARPGPFFVVMTGWLITGWAAVWMMQRWLWSMGSNADTSLSMDDLRRAEVVAVLILLIGMGLIASGWWTASLNNAADVTHCVRAGGIVT